MRIPALLNLCKKRSQYETYSPKQWYDIGKYAAERENSKAFTKYSPISNRQLSESHVWSFKVAYLKKINTQKRRLDFPDDTDNSELTELHLNTRGRKFLFGADFDSKVQTFVTCNNICISGGVIDTAIDMVSGRGIVLATCKNRSLQHVYKKTVVTFKFQIMDNIVTKANGNGWAEGYYIKKKSLMLTTWRIKKKNFLKTLSQKLNNIPPINW